MNDEPKNIWSLFRSGSRVKLFFVWLIAFGFLLAELGLADKVAHDQQELRMLGVRLDLTSPLLVFVLGAMLLVTLATLAVVMLCIFSPVGFRQWFFRRQILGRGVFLLACFVTLIALFYVEENIRGERAWESHRRAWEAKGEKFTIAALAPPPVPDEKNFALTPLLKPALDFTRENGSAVWRDTNAFEHLKNISASQTSGRPEDERLGLGSLEKGTFADLEACAKFYRGNTNYPQPATPGTAAADILVALGKFDPDVKELREAAASRPLARFPIEYDFEPSVAILLPHLAQMKALCMVTHVRAVARLELHQAGEAFEELRVGLRVSDSIRDEPILIDHLVRLATVSVNLQTVSEGLVRHAWSDAQLMELEKYLASLNLLAEYKLGMRGERALSVSTLDWARRQGFHSNAGNFFGDAPWGGDFGFAFMPRGWFYQNMLTIAQMHQDLTLPVVDEKARRVFPDLSAEATKATEDLGAHRFHPYKVFAALLFPAVSKAAMRSARTQTFVDAARVACALERYRLANGKSPDALDALAPRFIDRIPNDVIDGQPLRFRPQPDSGYSLYSVGWNKADDGGEVVFSKPNASTPSVDLAQGDWVWKMPGKKP